MKNKFLLTIAIVLGMAASAHAAKAQVHVTLNWTSPSAASTVTATNGVETAGPINATVYRAPATIASGVASCAAFSTTAYSVVSPTGGVAGTSSAANAGTYVDAPPTVGSVYCYAVTEAFQAGGASSGAAVSAPILALVFGTAAAPTNVTVVAGP